MVEDDGTRYGPLTEHFRLMAELSVDFVGMADHEGRVLYINPGARKLCGIGEHEDERELRIDAFHPRGAVFDRIREGIAIAQREGTWRGESALVTRSGEVIPGDQLIIAHNAMAGDVSVFSTVLRDLRPIRDLERQLADARRLEALGRLAGGVAHDFNNLLTVVDNATELVQANLEDHSQRQGLAMVLDASARAARLCRQLLSFAKRQVVRPRALNLDVSIEQFRNLAESLLGAHIQLTLELENADWAIYLDPAQLDHILTNLLANARDAMPNGGLVQVRTCQVSVGAEDPRHRQPGDYVELHVSDTGKGMSPDVKLRVLEPFFTTRAGQGAGLGLSTVHGAVEQSGGMLWFDSEPAKGARFSISWPRSQQRPQVEQKKETLGESPGGTIIVADDEAAVLSIVEQHLKSAGYKVLACASPSDALSLVQAEKPGLSLLLSDVIMPEMHGHALYQQLLAHYPELPVVYMSGYTAGALDVDGILPQGVQLIQKPFNRDQLLLAVDEAIRATAAVVEWKTVAGG